MTQSAPPVAQDSDDQLLQLASAGLSTRQIASKVHLSQSTVSRRLRSLASQRLLVWIAVMCTLLTLAMLVIAAALASMVWLT